MPRFFARHAATLFFPMALICMTLLRICRRT